MRSFHPLILLAFPLLGKAVAEELPASPTKQTNASPNALKQLYSSPNEAFQDLLNALPEESLHAALNSLSHFRDGIFESDRHGVERVHEQNPPLATKLIVEAVKDLKKRQQPTNGTIVTSRPPPDPQPSTTIPDKPPQSSQQQQQPPRSSAVLVPVVLTTTDAQGRTSVASTEVFSKPTASVAVAVTRTNAQGHSEVATETKPAIVVSTTDSAGRPVVTTSAVNYAPTIGQVLTHTDAKGSTFLTTFTPDGGRVSSLLLLTTTGADGQPTVVTSYTYVDPTGEPTGSPTTPGGSTAKPGLQNGATGHRSGDALLVGGAWACILAWLA